MAKILAVLLSMFFLTLSANAQGGTDSGLSRTAWQPVQAETLWHWIRRADDEAITLPAGMADALRHSIDTGDAARLNAAADRAAMTLLSAYHGQCCGPKLPAHWHIKQQVLDAELRIRIARALATNQVDLMLRASRPSHPHYRALAQAYAVEADPSFRKLLALNLARWRSLALPDAGRYLIVNAAAQELTMWDGDTLLSTRRVIVGKTSSPTPVFSVNVTGVVLNPWWNIPASIAAEGIASFVRRSPSAARARGYVYSNGRYRQRPGDNNALGRMKLVMPNRFSVFLHDTSNRDLFQREERTLSHGCVRVDQALDFAAALLEDAGWDREKTDEAVASNITQTIPLSQPVPLFIAYFTAVPDGAGGVRQLPDIYRRDAASLASFLGGTDKSVSSCAA